MKNIAGFVRASPARSSAPDALLKSHKRVGARRVWTVRFSTAMPHWPRIDIALEKPAITASVFHGPASNVTMVGDKIALDRANGCSLESLTTEVWEIVTVVGSERSGAGTILATC